MFCAFNITDCTMHILASVQRVSARGACVVSCPWVHVQHSGKKRTNQDPLAWQTRGTVHRQEQFQRGGHASVYHIEPHPTISVAIIDNRIIVAQRVSLNNQEKNSLVQLLPVGAYVGILFATRLMSTNLKTDMIWYICTT